MSRALPVKIDPYRLAAGGGEYDGVLALRQFSRLQPLLVDSTGQVQAALRFVATADGRTWVEGHVSASVRMVCQRCLEPMRFDIDTDLRLLVVDSEQAAEQVEDELEPIVVPRGETIHCVDLLEDELLLQLPLVPKHADPGDCEISGRVEDQPEPPSEATEPERKNPFAVLEKLKKH